MRLCLMPFLFLIYLPFMFSQTAFINEFHYDDMGGDNGEFVEVVIDLQSCTPTPCDPADFEIFFYIGSNGGTYGASPTLDLAENSSTVNNRYGIYAKNAGGTTNDPGGIALIFDNNGPNEAVLDFISYEGSFTASNGPAVGQTSTDVGVAESDSTPNGHSLQRNNFPGGTWVAGVDSPGQLNAGQEALPVTLSYLTAEIKNDRVHIQWETTQEFNNDHFRVQRSRNGKDWTTFTEKIIGNGTTDVPQRYAFTDITPLGGINRYRLQQFDYDGTQYYHGPVHVNFQPIGKLSVLPNPAADWVQVVTPAGFVGDGQLRLVDPFGCFIREISMRSGNTEVDLSGLVPGTYLLEWTDGQAYYLSTIVVK